MKLIYILDLPVYRVSEDCYYKARERHIVKTVCGAEINENEMTENQLYLFRKHGSQLSERYGGVWEYNEIVGYIKIHFLGQQVRGEYFTTKPVHKVKTRRKTFVYSTHKLAPEVNINLDSDNAEIFSKILEYVELCGQELPLRYIDSRYIKLLGPYLDWRQLIASTKNDYQGRIN